MRPFRDTAGNPYRLTESDLHGIALACVVHLSRADVVVLANAIASAPDLFCHRFNALLADEVGEAAPESWWADKLMSVARAMQGGLS